MIRSNWVAWLAAAGVGLAWASINVAEDGSAWGLEGLGAWGMATAGVGEPRAGQ